MNDPVIHALVGAQFGDLEFDVGKSVRWTQWFSDHLHVTDVNLGDQRYWIVNWEKTFPQVEHDVTGINYFAASVAFRKQQWAFYNENFQVDPEDWVLWVDAHEGVSFDITSLPDDYEAAPFRSWVYREVTRAETALKDRVVVPFYVFCASNEVQNIEILDTGGTVPGVGADGEDLVVPNTQQSVSVPFYIAEQGLTRLFKASVLQDESFDWASLDQLATPDVDVKMQLVSYAYAHWQYMDIENVYIGLPAISEENDFGFKMRKQISRIRPLAEFPYGHWDRDDTSVGLPGPWCTDIVRNTNPDLDVQTEGSHSAPDPTMAGLMTPLYDTFFRLNLRDGVWYEQGESGNIPLIWDSAKGKWITSYDPSLWPDHGVDAWNPYLFVGAQPYGESPYGYGPYGGNPS